MFTDLKASSQVSLAEGETGEGDKKNLFLFMARRWEIIFHCGMKVAVVWEMGMLDEWVAGKLVTWDDGIDDEEPLVMTSDVMAVGKTFVFDDEEEEPPASGPI